MQVQIRFRQSPTPSLGLTSELSIVMSTDDLSQHGGHREGLPFHFRSRPAFIVSLPHEG